MDRAVTVEKQAVSIRKMRKPRAFETLLAPGNFGERTRPRQVHECIAQPLAEAPVETCIVRDDDGCLTDEPADVVSFDRASCNHLFRQSGQRGH